MSKRAIVTGASAGIGRAVAEAMIADGWQVGLIARRADALDALAGGTDAVALPCDVTDAAAVGAAFTRFAQGGRLDVLFNNAGVSPPFVPIDEMALEDWDRTVAVNLTGMMLCARAAFGIMRRQDPQGGRIINNGSVSAQVPRIHAVAYTTTKHGVTGLTRSLSLDGRNLGISCGQIDIGNARTEMVENLARSAEATGEAPPPTIDVGLVAQAVLAMANLPAGANTLFQTIMANEMPFVGRG